jgi:hypothetical protein
MGVIGRVFHDVIGIRVSNTPETPSPDWRKPQGPAVRDPAVVLVAKVSSALLDQASSSFLQPGPPKR